MEAVGVVLEVVLWTFIALLWVRFVVDWVQVFARSWSPRGVLLVALEGVYSTTDPPIKALRRVIPPLRIGSVSLDLSFLIVMIAAYVLLRVNRQIFLLLTRVHTGAGALGHQHRRYCSTDSYFDD